MDIESILLTIQRIAARSPLPRGFPFGEIRSTSRQISDTSQKGARHQWDFGRTCSRRQIEAAEDQLGAELPAEVREFYRRIGNGGPGPCGGILSLEEAVSMSPPLDKHFPHSRIWTNSSLQGQASNAIHDLDHGKGTVEALDRASCTYEQAKFPGGALVIARDVGGDFLVVANGPETGNIWRNGVNEIAPVCPAENVPWTIDYENKSPRMSFGEWYIAWLQYEERISQSKKDR